MLRELPLAFTMVVEMEERVMCSMLQRITLILMPRVTMIGMPQIEGIWEVILLTPTAVEARTI